MEAAFHDSLPHDIDVVTVGTPDERIADPCGGVDASTIVSGHTHGQFERTVGGWQVVNAARHFDEATSDGAA